MSSEQPSTAPKPFVFVLMPFDASFNDVYALGIRPACEAAGAYCERVDEQIFQESILQRIYNQISKADVVVADMTGRSANVFYETGYAHALGKHVILLTQRDNDIPFDLKHYPHIIYGGNIAGMKQDLERRVRWCIEKANQSAQSPREKETVRRRLDRILTIINVERDLVGTIVVSPQGGGKRKVSIPARVGDFRLYTGRPGQSGVTVLYVSPLDEVNLEKELADVRVLMEACSRQGGVKCTFVLASNQNLSHRKQAVSEAFERIKGFIKPEHRDNFKLEIWDKDTLLLKERELGIRVDWSSDSSTPPNT